MEKVVSKDTAEFADDEPLIVTESFPEAAIEPRSSSIKKMATELCGLIDSPVVQSQ